MPSFKLSGAKAVEQKSGFEPYDGPEPTRAGFYRALVKVMKHGLNANSGSQGFAITLELDAAPGDPKGHAIFDGKPMFSRSIITSGKDDAPLKEGAVRNLNNLLAALGTGDEPQVVLDPDATGDKADVKKIGKVNPIGRVVNIDLGFELYEGDRRPTINGIYPYKEIDAPASTGRPAALEPDEDEPEDESDLMEDEAEEAEEGEDDEYSARQAELEALGIPALKAIAKEDGVGVSGTKAALIERILDAEFAEEDEAEDAEEPDDEPEDDEAEEEEAEDDEPEDEEEEEEDDAEREARQAELDSMARPALKAVLKEIAPDFTVLKRHSDDDLRAEVLKVEFAEDLPF